MRGAIARAVVLLGSTLLCLVALELVLRAYPLLLGDTYANGVLSKYSNREGGIYYYDPSLRMNFMVPNFATTMYYNRYVWTHETDALGFRNRGSIVPSDVMLLGDSLIYGHGVEYQDTVGYLLHQMTGLTVANLARQGDCAFQEAYLLTAYLPVVRARFVFYHFFENDISDLPLYLSEAAMRDFVATPVTAIRYAAPTPVAEALHQRAEGRARRPLFRRLRDSSYVFKMYRFVRQSVLGGTAHAGPSEGEDSLGWRYTRHAIQYMQEVSRRADAVLVVVPITPHRPDQYRILEKIAAEEGLPFVDTSSLGAGDDSLWLRRDGHFSPAGAQRLAGLESAYLRRAGAIPAAPRPAPRRSPAPGPLPGSQAAAARPVTTARPISSSSAPPPSGVPAPGSSSRSRAHCPCSGPVAPRRGRGTG